MNAAELIRWLTDNAARLQYGEISLKIIIHDGTIKQIEKTCTERERPGQNG